MKPITINTLNNFKKKGERITCLTCYDSSFTRILEEAGIELLLVGDSLGNVLQGHANTLPVTIDNMVYHAACVTRVRKRALVIVDLPFLSYSNPKRALEAAGRLIQEGGADMVKLEGGSAQLETVAYLANQGIAVCAHLGLTPQSIQRLGGYRVQGRTEDAAELVRKDALALETAGANLLVLECVPSALAAQVTNSLQIPVIGIGAGAACDGQVLVLHDMLGLHPDGSNIPRFVKNFFLGKNSIQAAISAYVDAVKSGEFPALEQSFD